MLPFQRQDCIWELHVAEMVAAMFQGRLCSEWEIILLVRTVPAAVTAALFCVKCPCVVCRRAGWFRRQINYLGPYTLTRCLERTLQRSAPSRVVNVSSVMHRFASLRNARDALFVWNRGAGDYSVSKLNNALFAYELQRRLGKHGVQV